MIKEPERILKKNENGPQMKYQIKWKGFEELTWELEEVMQKHKELIEDYNYFTLTGERYDEQQLENIRQQFNQSQPKTAIKRAAAAKAPSSTSSVIQNMQEEPRQLSQQQQQQAPQPSKAQKKVDKLQNIEGDKKQLMLENQQHMVILHQQSHKISNILSVKQNEMTKKIASLYATPEDQINMVKLQVCDSQMVFQIQWKTRSDGSTPLPEYYQYDQFKLVAPLLYIQFVEQCLFQAQSKETDIKFVAPLINLNQLLELIGHTFTGKISEVEQPNLAPIPVPDQLPNQQPQNAVMNNVLFEADPTHNDNQQLQVNQPALENNNEDHKFNGNTPQDPTSIPLPEKFLEEVQILDQVEEKAFEKIINFGISYIVKHDTQTTLGEVLELDEVLAESYFRTAIKLISFYGKFRFGDREFKSNIEFLRLKPERKAYFLQKLESNWAELHKRLSFVESDGMPYFKYLDWRFDLQIASRAYDEELKPRIFLQFTLENQAKEEIVTIESDYANLKNLHQEISYLVQQLESSKQQKIKKLGQLL